MMDSNNVGNSTLCEILDLVTVEDGVLVVDKKPGRPGQK